MVKRLPPNVAGYELGRQLICSGTSIGANVEEADAAESRKDFIHKLSIARKEARETRYWLRLIKAELLDDEEVTFLIQECKELVRILSAIIRSPEQGKSGHKPSRLQ